MFEAFVLACLVDKHHMCITLKDLYGPYDTRSQCVARAKEIDTELPKYMEEYFVKDFQCIEMNPKIKI